MRNSIILSLFCMSFVFCQNNVYVQGEKLYKTYCGNCHGEKGEGLKNLYPPLNSSDYLEENQDKLACIILNGMEEEIVVNGKKYTMPMAPIPNLTDVEITNIINYINTAWDNDLPVVKITDVKSQLANCE